MPLLVGTTLIIREDVGLRFDAFVTGRISTSGTCPSCTRLDDRTWWRRGPKAAGWELGAGPLYQDGDLVFTSGHGTPLDARNNVNRHYKPLLKQAGLPPSASTTSGTRA